MPMKLPLASVMAIAGATMSACGSDSSDNVYIPTGDASTTSDGSSNTDGSQSDTAVTDRAIVDSGDPIVPEDWCQTGDTLLAQTVQGMTAGSWAELPDNPSLNQLDLHYHLTAWADTGVWNPRARRVQWVGGPGSCCATPAAFKMLDYDVASDTWSVIDTPWGDDSGHAYDGNALDPITGLHYFAHGGGDIRTWDGITWGDSLPAVSFYHTIAVGITWFRDVNQGQGALVHVGPQTNVGVFDGQNWQELEAQTAGWGGYHMFAEYNPVHHLVWLGAGNDGVRQHAKLTTDLEIVQLQDAPVDLNATGSAQKTYDPRSGKFIVLSTEDDSQTWFEYDIVNDIWTDITSAMQPSLPPSWGSSGFRFVIPIDDCGVIFLFRHSDTERRAYLYKHTD